MMNNLAKLRPDSFKRHRISSHDKTGGNHDWKTIPPITSLDIADFRGFGCITHIWCTIKCKSKHFLRNTIIYMYWDGENDASVQVPIGDFFGMGHGESKNFVSEPLQMSPRKGKGFNCWFPMPFCERFKISISNLNDKDVHIYYYVDFETYPKWYYPFNTDYGRFHAQFRRENPTVQSRKVNRFRHPFRYLTGGKNLHPFHYNYVILQASGKGHFVGCHVDIDNYKSFPFFNWFGEGDDMFLIDSKPDLMGTGTEDYFNMAFCPRKEYSAPYHGCIKKGKINWRGKTTYYRYHIKDPIYFNYNILVTMEHGHNNRRIDDWSSTAYWYQKEPHARFPTLPNKEGRKPRNRIKKKLRNILISGGLILGIILLLR